VLEWAWAAGWIRSMWWMPTWRWSPASVSIMSTTWGYPRIGGLREGRDLPPGQTGPVR
jgi:hypothetical protein